jgi:HK97 family phage prohead protease
MPLKRCQTDDQPGWKWGDEGKCYPYTASNEESETAARKKALAQAAAMGEFPGTGNRSDPPVEILQRFDAFVTEDVSFKQRMIDVIAVPWDQEAEILWRGEWWREIFDRRAFNEAVQNSVRIPVNREHVRGDTVGRIVAMNSTDQRGLLASVKVAKTPRGDDTLQLASEGMLGASIGYFVRKPSDVDLDRPSMLRRVKRAFLEHLSMVESPAFAGAEAVATYDGLSSHPAAGEQPLTTPLLDQWLADDILSKTKARFDK